MPSIKDLAPYIRNIYEAINEAKTAFMMTVLEKDDRQIFFVGTKHTRNPKDRQVLDLIKAFTKTIEESGREVALCLEGNVPGETSGSLDEVVARAGEQAALLNVAIQEKIKPLSIEPSFKRINELTSEIFSDRKALASWALLNFLSGITKDGKIGIEKKDLFIKVLGSIGNQYEITGEGLSVFDVLRDYLAKNNIVDLPNFDQIFESGFDREKIIEAQKPNNGSHITNKAAVCINLARDFGLMENTLNIFERTDKDLFVWQGLNHVVSQLPAYLHLGFKEIK
jgi:hypothetical protein